MHYDVSIIVPIYQVEPYIQRCANSLFSQNFSAIEFIFVNDATCDNSIALLLQSIEHYPHRKQHCRIIHHEHNRGLGAARTTGILAARGEYLLHVDSDDFIDEQAVELLYKKAQQDDADIVGCDFYLDERHVVEPYHKSVDENIKALFDRSMYPSLCTRLVKKTLYTDHDIFPPHNINFAEDMHTTIRLFFKAQRISYVNKPLYHYIKRPASLTGIATDQTFVDFDRFANDIEHFLHQHNAYHRYAPALMAGHISLMRWLYGHYQHKRDFFRKHLSQIRLQDIWRTNTSVANKCMCSIIFLHNYLTLNKEKRAYP